MNTKTKTNAKTNTGKAKWTAKQIERAKRKYAAFTSDRRAKVDKAARECGIEPWEYVADTLCMLRGGKSKAAGTAEGKAEAPTREAVEALFCSEDAPKWADVDRMDTGKAGRIERWRTIAQGFIESGDDMTNGDLALVAEMSGKPAVSLVVDYMCEHRGLNRGASESALRKRLVDMLNECGSARLRNNEERMAVRGAITDVGWTQVTGGDFTAAEKREIARLFFRKGDTGLDSAIVRAALRALECEADRIANASR